jgi:hypothetical protein
MQFKLAGYVVLAVLLGVALLVTYLQVAFVMPSRQPSALQAALPTKVVGDLAITSGGRLVFPMPEGGAQLGAVLQVEEQQGAGATRYGLGVYPGHTLRLFGRQGGEVRIGQAASDGAFDDALVINKTGDVGIGVDEPSARLHVGGDVSIEGAVNIGRYVLRAGTKGLEACRQDTGQCSFLFEEVDAAV